jgi:uncharacterized protein (TIGR02246 family)
MRFRYLVIAACLAVGSVAAANAQTPDMTRAAEPDEAAITRILDDEGAAWLRGDADAFGAHVVPDVVFVNTVGMFSVGKHPFVAQHQGIFATIYKGSEMRQFIEKITFIGGDIAIVDTVTKLSGMEQLPTGAAAVDGALYTRLEQVMVRTGGEWSVASFHNVPIQPKFVDERVRSLTSTRGH